MEQKLIAMTALIIVMEFGIVPFQDKMKKVVVSIILNMGNVFTGPVAMFVC